MDYSYYVRKYFCQICKFKASWGVSKIVKFTYFCDLTWPFCTKISLMPSLGLYRQISNFFFCISSFDAKTSMYAKNHENLGHGMCHPLPGFSLDGLLSHMNQRRKWDISIALRPSSICRQSNVIFFHFFNLF